MLRQSNPVLPGGNGLNSHVKTGLNTSARRELCASIRPGSNMLARPGLNISSASLSELKGITGTRLVRGFGSDSPSRTIGLNDEETRAKMGAVISRQPMIDPFVKLVLSYRLDSASDAAEFVDRFMGGETNSNRSAAYRRQILPPVVKTDNVEELITKGLDDRTATTELATDIMIGAYVTNVMAVPGVPAKGAADIILNRASQLNSWQSGFKTEEATRGISREVLSERAFQSAFLVYWAELFPDDIRNDILGIANRTDAVILASIRHKSGE